MISHCGFIFLRFYLFIFKEMGKDGEREGEKHQCVRDILTSCLSHTPDWIPDSQSRHMPLLGIEPVTV